MRDEILEMGKKAREASHLMAMANSNQKRESLEKMASALERERESIGAANRKDVEAGGAQGAWKGKNRPARCKRKSSQGDDRRA